MVDWRFWEYAVDEEGRLIVVPTDAPFSMLPENPFDKTIDRRLDDAEDPEYVRARRAHLV